MLPLTIPAATLYNSETNEFIDTKEQTLMLEHSLVSISKWESKYCIPFIGHKLTMPEFQEYVRCMTISQNISPYVYLALTKKNVEDIKEYMDRKMTASTFHGDRPRNTSGEFVTSETIYYLMFTYNIPKECEKWHINRLMPLIRYCQLKSEPPKKMSAAETEAYYAKLNAARKKQWGTKG